MIKSGPLKINDPLIKNMVVCNICLDCFKIDDIVCSDEVNDYHRACYLTKEEK